MPTPYSWSILQNQLLSDFLPQITTYLQELQIFAKVETLFADHLALRYTDQKLVDDLKEKVSGEGVLISSAVVNGREIFIFELSTPLHFGTWKIPCLELPYPKENQPYADGWEHVEFVIPSKATTMEDFKKDFIQFFPEVSIDTLMKKGQYTESMPVVETEQIPNPSIVLRKSQNIIIKFHGKTIKEVVS